MLSLKQRVSEISLESAHTNSTNKDKFVHNLRVQTKLVLFPRSWSRCSKELSTFDDKLAILLRKHTMLLGTYCGRV